MRWMSGELEKEESGQMISVSLTYMSVDNINLSWQLKDMWNSGI